MAIARAFFGGQLDDERVILGAAMTTMASLPRVAASPVSFGRWHGAKPLVSSDDGRGMVATGGR